MADIDFNESVGILKIIHRQYRTALLNKKYYGYQLSRFKNYNFWLEVLIAVGATSATGTGIAGLTIWKSGLGVAVWAILSSISIILATLKPFLNLSAYIERYSKLWSEYANMHSTLQQIEEDLEAKSGLNTEQVAAFEKVRSRMPDLAALDDKNPNKEAILQFETEVKKEIPVDTLWMPRRPRQLSGVASSLQPAGPQLNSSDLA